MARVSRNFAPNTHDRQLTPVVFGGKSACLYAFTLVEFVLVMALLATVMAISAPVLSRFVRQRNVVNESVRLVAVTEYARTEAVSRGVPFEIWVDVEAGEYGVEPAPGFPVRGDPSRGYRLRKGISAEVWTDEDGDVVRPAREDAVIVFDPDGYPSEDSAEAIALTGRDEAARIVARSRDRWRYESVTLKALNERRREVTEADDFAF